MQINLLNNHLKNLTNFNKYKFKIELKIKDNLYEQNLSKEKYLSFLLNSREYDKKFGGSRFGPHKSDFYVTINDEFDANQLSTGQQKTLILMLLLAQCDYLLNNKNIKPVLLFDEICSHLDDINRKILLELTDKFEVQFFFTGTDKTLFSFMSTKVNFYNITDLWITIIPPIQ